MRALSKTIVQWHNYTLVDCDAQMVQEEERQSGGNYFVSGDVPVYSSLYSEPDFLHLLFDLSNSALLKLSGGRLCLSICDLYNGGTLIQNKHKHIIAFWSRSASAE